MDAVPARDESMLGAEDEDHLRRCIELNRVLISHHQIHFEELYARYIQEGIRFPGIIILTCHRDVFDLAKRIAKFFSQHHDISNQLWCL